MILASVIGVQFYITSMNSVKETFNRAPELQGIAGYINTDPIKLEDFKGKVILVDFWTYTCINCIRTLPYLNSWYEKYSDDGLVIIGVHTPEFEFEKSYENVLSAVKKYNVKYPVVQDNDYKTWNAYQNKFWPTKYLIDIDGNIRYNHIGEGAYEETEKMIQEVLSERAKKNNVEMTEEISKPQSAVDVDFRKIGTPEIYLGYKFARVDLGNEQGFEPEQTVDYKLPNTIVPNMVYLEGTWKNNPDHMELVSDTGKIVLFYSAKDVNIVAGQNSVLSIFLDGVSVGESSGSDVIINNKVLVREQTLYNIVSGNDYNSRLLEIDIEGKGFEIYTFTFG